MDFNNLEFIGWDCEGINDGFIDNWTERQKLVLIAVSTGDYLYNENGIPQKQRLEFIARIARRYPSSEYKHVFFGGSYDFNKILEGIPANLLRDLHEAKNQWTLFLDEWLFRYRPRKELTIAHVPNGFNPLEKVQNQCDSYIRFWDVIGFFQSSFLDVIDKWLGRDYEDYELIASGKIARLNFQGDDKEFMLAYNKAETKALVKVMEILHEQLIRLDLKISRWDGAGAIAAQVFRKYALKDSFFQKESKKDKIILNQEIETACRYAYFGGRIESGFIGRYEGEIFNYDINSAYPYAASLLPNLNNGEWRYHSQPITEIEISNQSIFTLYRIRWYFHLDRTYYPFPFRGSDGSVIFPKEGERWLFAPEVKSGIHSLKEHDRIEVLEAWEFVPYTQEENTFQTLETLYYERQRMIEKKDPAEKILKLGLNSIYGKLCQKLGWNEELKKSPAFHFLFFAGWITSFTRAAIYSAVQTALNDVIAINTDGIVSKCLLPLRIHKDKNFGGWSLEKADEIVQLQSGVYWIRNENVWKEKARGLGRVAGEGANAIERKESRNRKIIERVQKVLDGWRTNKQKIQFPVKQFITSKKSLISTEWFQRWGHWYIMHDSKTGEKGRSLELQCTGWGKRRLGNKPNPNKLIKTIASVNIEWSGEGDLGAPYNLPWISKDDYNELDDSDDLIAE